MAGDWIKMEAATPEKSETLAITAAMGWDDPDLAVGKLFRVWRWFDQQTIDGNARGVTSALLDRVAGVTGFANAMASVGWLIVDDDGITLPNFDRHNGKTAKARALGAKRTAKSKSRNGFDATASDAPGNAKGNASTVTSPSPREEKRREEETEIEAPTAEQPDSDKPTPLTPQQTAVGMVLDAFDPELRPAAGLAARWISLMAEGRRNPDFVAAAEIVREIVWKHPAKPAEYIGKCVSTAALKALTGDSHDRNRTDRRSTPRPAEPGAPPVRDRAREEFGHRDAADVLRELREVRKSAAGGANGDL